MSLRILTDENVEPETRTYLCKLGHDIEHVVTVAELGESALDEEIAAYARRTDRLILTQDDDFLAEIDPRTETAGVLYQQDQQLSGKQVGDVVETIDQLLPRDEIVLEYVSANWL